MSSPGRSLAARPGAWILARALSNAAASWLCVAALAWAVSGAEGQALSLPALALLLGPFAWAFGASISVAGAVRRGEWSGWEALGHGPLRLAGGLLLVGVAAGLLSLSAGGALEQVPGWSLPSPISPDLRFWPDDEGWQGLESSRWTVAPAALSTTELIARARADLPEGGRAGVDAAEGARRLGWAAAWPLGALLGLAFGRRAQRGTSLGTAVAASWAGALVGLWLLVVALLAAYASTIT